MNLPIVELEVLDPNPDFVAQWVINERGNRVVGNYEDYYVKIKVTAEVVQLNLNKETMRVRYRSPLTGKWKTPDVSIAPFFAKYHIAQNQLAVDS